MHKIPLAIPLPYLDVRCEVSERGQSEHGGDIA
jgi:hypothetical protein